MRRKIENELIKWKHQQMRLPLLIRGARQVGKTYAVENFGKDHFEHLVLINLEQNPEYINCFNTLDPQNIIAKIEILKGKEIKIGKTLLFIDEIQESSNAVLALRYFKEQMPDLHVIGAGSLLEFILNDEKFRMPVGRIQFLHMFPMSFLEFIEALGYSKVIEYLE